MRQRLAYALVHEGRAGVLRQLHDIMVAAAAGLHHELLVAGDLARGGGVDGHDHVELAGSQAGDGAVLLAFAVVQRDAVQQRQFRRQ